MLKETIHIQSKEAREKIINQFCRLITIFSLASFILYIYLKVLVLAAATGFIAVLFLFFVYLNKKQLFYISRTAIILTTNVGVIFFSLFLGYNSGIYLYLFASPLLTYLLFDFNKKKTIAIVLLFYVATFVFIFSTRNSTFILYDELTPRSIQFIYAFNFCSTLVLCFGLVRYFATNNDNYIFNLFKQQDLLIQEVDLRNKSEDLLRKSLNEREILLGEIHHRVKNNLAIVSALISMQIENLEEDKSKQIFEETKNRIYAMSLIHNLLYQNKSFAKIDFVEYINTFCINVSKSYQMKSVITIEQTVDDIEIDINTAIPLALMLNEFVTNSFKHAFKDRDSGKITVGLLAMENKHLKFWISDTGCGMDDSQLNANSMGMNIIRSLVEQIEGDLKYVKNEGSNFTVIFPLTQSIGN